MKIGIVGGIGSGKSTVSNILRELGYMVIDCDAVYKDITNEKEYMYVIYSVYVEAKDFSYMNINFSDEQEWYNHIKSFKNKSMYDTLEDVAANDEILILQTCSTHKDYLKYDRKFLLVVAKQVK